MKGERYCNDTNVALQGFITTVLPTLDFDETIRAYAALLPSMTNDDVALLGCNDRFFLLTALCGRADAIKPWLFDRCREVEADPDDHLDLWAREHYKSTIITFAGTIQEIVSDPDITIGLFSFTQPIARAFVKQVKLEFEQNEWLKAVYADCLFQNPKNESPRWTDDGFIVKRKSNPKEGTLEGWGLVNGQPTSKHYALRIYDDVVTRDSVTNPEMVKKVTEAYELSDNLGGHDQRKWLIGTRYSFADTYGAVLNVGVVKPRIYPATHNGRIDGDPVFFAPEVWEKKKREQSSQIAAQMLQNPLAGTEQVFNPIWLRPYVARPRTMTVYIMGDPSKGKSAKSDRTAIAVIGIDANRNKYLLDGYRHRMSQSQRWDALKTLYHHWTRQMGVQLVSVGWERYGLQTDDEYFLEKMEQEGFSFPITELSWTREGNESKRARVERLQPDLEHSSFYLPGLVYQPGSVPIDPATGKLDWSRGKAIGSAWWIDPEKGQVQTKPLFEPTREMRELDGAAEGWRIARPIIRRDENGKLYDVTRAFMEEAIFFPFGTHDDLIDAVSRIYDMDPVPPAIGETPARIGAREETFTDA